MANDLRFAPAGAKPSQFNIDRAKIIDAMTAANLPNAAARMNEDEEIAARWVKAFRLFAAAA